MSNPTTSAVAVPLSHEALEHMLEEHAKYVATRGRQGKEVGLSLFIVEDYDFSGLDLAQAHFYASAFVRCRFVNTDLYYTDFDSAQAPGGDFQGAMLAKATFYQADLRGACFDGASLTSASFLESDLTGATFLGAELNSTSFTGSDMTDTVFDPEVPLVVRQP